MTGSDFTRPELSPLRLREVTFPNRVWMSPMAQYAAGPDGKPTDWHLVHYGARAVGAVGLIMVEASAVGPLHRTTTADLGIWNEDQAAAHRRLTAFIRERGTVPGIQLQAAGRKGSHQLPWVGAGQNGSVGAADGGWPTFGPSAIPFGDLAVPREADHADIDEVVEAFARAARMADLAGYRVVEIQAAHGYLLHEFLSPLSNRRTDEYGGSPQNRMRLALRVARAVRDAFPAGNPVSVRITATDWLDGGLTIDDAVLFAKELAAVGIDLLDVTSGLVVRDQRARPPVRSGVHVEFAGMLRGATGLAVTTVGQIEDVSLIGRLVANGEVDAAMLGRSLLRDPYFALRTPPTDRTAWPDQYQRAL
ncbi:NADH:flavin oxidoreductase/NADH oxidase [Nocardia sp. NPDC057030]|uniref:NADH:flavin oxidoreductase/NADH oxidase n=1 Tax=unclassified Nocardia TaxID=2637762 RepID=UPI0036337857